MLGGEAATWHPTAGEARTDADNVIAFIIEQLQAIFGYRNAYIFPERVFLPQINNLLDDAGRLKDAELLARLKSQAEGFVDFVERLQKIKLTPA